MLNVANKVLLFLCCCRCCFCCCHYLLYHSYCVCRTPLQPLLLALFLHSLMIWMPLQCRAGCCVRVAEFIFFPVRLSFNKSGSINDFNEKSQHSKQQNVHKCENIHFLKWMILRARKHPRFSHLLCYFRSKLTVIFIIEEFGTSIPYDLNVFALSLAFYLHFLWFKFTQCDAHETSIHHLMGVLTYNRVYWRMQRKRKCSMCTLDLVVPSVLCISSLAHRNLFI